MKPIRIWSAARFKCKPRVMQLPHGGLLFEYYPVYHCEGGRCSFSFYCEVGEVYKPAFARFFAKHTLAEAMVEVPNSPYYYDKLK